MTNGKKIAVWLSVAVVLSIAGYFGYTEIYLPYKAKKSAGDKKTDDTPKTDNTTTGTQVPTAGSKPINKPTPSTTAVEAGAAPAPDAFPLKKGSKGLNVGYLQRALNTLGAGIDVDNNFGDQTYGAVLTQAGTKYYPVDSVSFAAILKMANNKNSNG